MKAVFKNEYFFSIISRIITIALSFFKSVVIARFLGASLKGTSEYIMSIVSIGSIIITFGMHQAYPYLRKKYGKDKIFCDYISVVSILFIVYGIIAICLSVFALHNLEIRVAILLIPIFGYSDIMAYVCLIENPNKRNRYWTLISFFSLVFSFIVWRSVRTNMIWMVIILVVEEVLKSIVYTFSVRPKIRIHKELRKMFTELFKLGVLPMIALLLTTLNYKIDVLMLKSFDCISTAQIGVYSIGILFADKIALIPDTLKGVMVSKLAKGADEHEVAKVSRICFCSTLGFCIFVLIIGRPIIDLLYGNEYNGAYTVLIICSFGTIFIGYFKLIAQYNIVNKKQIRNIVLLMTSVIVNMGLNIILIPKLYLKGAALASGVGYFLSGIIFVTWFARQSRIKLSEMFVLQKSDIDSLKTIINRNGENK